MKVLSDLDIQEYLKGIGAQIGDLIYFNGTGLAPLTPGLAGQALVSAGVGNAPVYSSSFSSSGGNINKTIFDQFGGQVGDLDLLNSASFTTGDSIMFRDVNNHLWAYVLKAGVVTGGTLTTITPATDVIGDTSTSFQNLLVGDQIQLTTTGALPSGLSIQTRYYVKTKPTSTTATLSLTLGGATVDILSGTGGGTHYWMRHESPYRVIPRDYNPAVQPFYWEWVRSKWDYFPLSFVAFPGAATLSNIYLARHTFSFEIVGWGLSCEVPVATPGSGSQTNFIANLQKTGATNNTRGTALAPANLSLTQGLYFVHFDFTKPEYIISVSAGEALYLNTISAGNVAPQGVEVHLYCRCPLLMI